MIDIKPIFDNVCIKALPNETVTPGGLHIPPAAEGTPQKGIVAAVGPGRVDANNNKILMSVEVADMVYYGKYSGVEIEFEGDQYIIMPESDILAIIED